MQNGKVVTGVDFAFLDRGEEILVGDGVGKAIAFSNNLIVGFGGSV